MQPPKNDICVICTVRPAKTTDHVPPKSFFKGVVNAQLPTVSACWECNNGDSSDDEDVRFFISAQIGKQNPASKQLWEMGAHKTILRKSKLREEFFATAREVDVLEKDGSHRTKIEFLVSERPYSRVFERTTRGLYFYHSGKILPADVPVSVTMLVGTPNMDTDDIRALKVEVIGAGACAYRYGIALEEVDCSLWVYEFHHAHWALVTTGSVR